MENKKVEMLVAIRDIMKTQMFNKVVGRRNWVIRFDNKKAMLYTYGQAKNWGALRLYLSDVVNCGDGILYFTYKKDAFEMLDKFKENGWKTDIWHW